MKLKFFSLIACIILLASCSTSDDGNSETNNNGNNNTPQPLMGTFVDGAHPTSGTVVVNAERTTMNFTDFMTDFGPILNVYLCTNQECGNFIDLGELQALSGDFSYNLSQNLNFDSYEYVVIWCVEFSVGFGSAKLE